MNIHSWIESTYKNISVPIEEEERRMRIIKKIYDFERAEQEIIEISILTEKEEKYNQLNFMVGLYHDQIIDQCKASFNLITKY